MSVRSTGLARTGSVLGVAVLAGVMLVGCTAGNFGAPSAVSPSVQPTKTPGPDLQKPVDPTQVPPVATAPPTFPVNEPGRQDSVLETLPGKAKAGCVDVGDMRDVRSGSMAAGNFVDARAQFSASPTAGIPFYFIPVETKGDPELTVDLERVDAPGSTKIRSSQIQTADEWQYYPVTITVPEAGTWRIKASAGTASAGCWVATFAR